MNARIASIAAVAVLTIGVAVTAQKGDPGIQKLTDEYQAAFNKGDAKALGALYAADALRVGPDGQLLTGRAAIEKNHADNLAGPSKGTKLTLRPGRTQTLTADVALAEGTYEVTGGSAPAKGRYLNTLVRQSGQWRLASVVAIPETGAK